MPISLPSIPFDSPLIEYVVELERLRGDVAAATTSNPMVAELHQLFDLVSSLVSARIEGNRTTIYDAVVGARTGKAAAFTASTTFPATPPATARISSLARSMARRCKVKSTPRSKRCEESVCKP